MSLRAKLLNQWLRMTEKPHMRRANVAKMRRSLEVKSRTLFWAPRGTQYKLHGLGGSGRGVPALTIEKSGNGPHVLYFHGGGYVFGSPHTHRAMLAWLSDYADTSVTAIAYKRAPEDPFPQALIDALIAYRSLKDTPGGVVLGGDSAGGGLALALLGEIIRTGLRQPVGTFVFSPLTDLTFSGDSLRKNAQAEVVLPAERVGEMASLYLGDVDPANPKASPLFAEFTGASPIWMTAGDTEILLDDTTRMAERLTAQGVDVTCEIERDLPHVWPIFKGYIPEAEATLRAVAAWIKALSHRSGDS